ncbi:uncharacterized protein LOC110232312 isoform X1 [Exaiptasia diaphana]|uniref:Uncharacterized protein n=1 Tax=Exaiptasia diaphana TaxID=2652724 RepID=A0A913WRU1_EXADI|nr:uncharacterized protein LOC110232312 isoform X1 [Exaiptasia diaphana]KXJ27987.1 hypothetical protein AC249_AIPGENE21739 [Exaiptasia diaphana]
MANRHKSGEWFESAESPSNDTVETPRVSNISCLSTEEPVPDTPRSKIRSEDTDFVKLAKTGGHKDLLAPTPENKPPSPRKSSKSKKDNADWYYQDRVNNNEPPQTPRSKVKDSDTEFLKTAKEGGHKDLLMIKEHKPTDSPVQYNKKGGDWYTHDGTNGVDSVPSTPRSKVKASDTEFLKTAKEGGHKALLEIKEHEPTKTPKKYNKKGGDWYYQDGVNIKESLQKRDHATPASARVQRNYRKLQIRKDDTAYVKTAKMGGHSDLLHTPRNTPSKTPVSYKRSDWFYLEDNKSKPHERPRTAPRRTPTMSSTVLPSDSTDSGSRPRTAYTRSTPIWLGGTGSEVQPSPRKHISRDSGLAPYALHF